MSDEELSERIFQLEQENEKLKKKNEKYEKSFDLLMLKLLEIEKGLADL